MGGTQCALGTPRRPVKPQLWRVDPPLGQPLGSCRLERTAFKRLGAPALAVAEFGTSDPRQGDERRNGFHMQLERRRERPDPGEQTLRSRSPASEQLDEMILSLLAVTVDDAQ